MRKITFRGHEGAGDPDAYWRRRFFILGGGLAVLMLAAWLFGGGGPSRQESQSATARASAAAREAREVLPRAAYGTPYGAKRALSKPVMPSPSANGGPSATPSPSSSGRAAAAGSAAAGPAAARSAAAGSGAGKHCPAGSVVLSLFTSQQGYRRAQQPKFSIYAVSTSASACRLKYGPAAVRVVVTRQGRVVWDSAACKTIRQPAKTVVMAPGVPQEVALSWNRKASAQPCAGALPRGKAGTFQAVAQADGRTSPVRTFRLLG